MAKHHTFWCNAVSILTVVVCVSGTLNEMPRNTTVVIGDSTFFNCSTTMSVSESQFRWTLNNDEFIYGAGKVYPKFAERFSVEKNENQGSYNLIIRDVTKQDAGSYECHDHHHKSAAQLIVLDSNPICRSSMNPDGVIGPNSCDLDPEDIHLSCSATYTGKTPPKLRWVKKDDETAITDGLSCKNLSNSINCTLTIPSDISLHGSTFACQTEDAANVQYACSVEPVKVLYARNNFRPTVAHQSDKVNCFANSSQPCKYYWEWCDRPNDISAMVLGDGAVLWANNTGIHRCEAECVLRGKTCTVTAMLVKVEPDTETVTEVPVTSSKAAIQSIVIIVLAVLLGLLLIVALTIGFCTWSKKRKTVGFCTRIKNLEKNAAKLDPEVMVLNNLDEVDNPGKEIQKLQKQITEQAEQWARVVAENQNLEDRIAAIAEVSEQENNKLQQTINQLAKLLYNPPEASTRLNLSKNGMNIIKPKTKGGLPCGLTVLQGKLFVVFDEMSVIEIYNMKTLNFFNEVKVPGLYDPGDIKSCEKTNRFFILDWTRKNEPCQIYMLDINGTVQQQWTIDHGECRLSITKDSTLVVTNYDKDNIVEYKVMDNGDLKDIKTINVKMSAPNPWHAVKLIGGFFVVCHGKVMRDGEAIRESRVCIVDDNGREIKSFDMINCSNTEVSKHPACLELRPDRSIMVAYQTNVGVHQLDSYIENIMSEVISPVELGSGETRIFRNFAFEKRKEGQKNERFLLIDCVSRKLKNGDDDWDDGRILVYDVIQ